MRAREPPPTGSWPLWTIDFEASSLEDGSYPIEVGLAVWPASDQPIYGWSTLIRPAWDWLESGHWSRKSRAVHGIAQSELGAGRSPTEVARILNGCHVPGRLIWCDGGEYDVYWLRRLFTAAGATPAFCLAEWHTLATRLDPAAWERVLASLARSPCQHRARKDAERLLLALAEAIGIDPGPPLDLHPA